MQNDCQAGGNKNVKEHQQWTDTEKKSPRPKLLPKFVTRAEVVAVQKFQKNMEFSSQVLHLLDGLA